MAFRFRFESLLQLSRRQRDQAAVDLGQAGEAIARVQSEMEAIESKRLAAREAGGQARTGEISVDDLLTRGRYDLQLEAEIHSLQQTLRQLEAEADRRRTALVEAEAEVKRFERLQEKDRTQYLAQQRRQEQFEADDDTCRRYTLQHQASRHDL